ncbi:TRAP transporter substrate-binding protein [Halodesulfovibrio aestuarii]|uniref:TRAP transporter substrate-binding protein n=1 Tax=Halodesulfovibrio aestuarii TaxID=126333 RepID=UPI0004061536
MFRKALVLVALVAMMAVSSVSFAQDPTILRIGMGDPIDSEMGAIATRFKEIVEGRTDGKVEVQIFPSGQLGDETEMIQNVRRGNLDMAVVGIANTVPFVKKLGILTLPYLFENMYDVVRGATGPAHEMLNEFAVKEGGFRVLGWTYTDYRYLSNSQHPIKKLADVKDMKFRVPQSAVILETYRSWGANPVPISWAETFTALQQGVVDGQCYGYITFQAAKFNEVQKYITEVHYTYQLQPMMISERLYKKLTPEMQQLVVDAGREAQEYCLAFQLVDAGRAKAELIASGIQIDTLEDEAEWKKLAVNNVWPKMTDFVGGQKVLDRYLGYIGKK